MGITGTLRSFAIHITLLISQFPIKIAKQFWIYFCGNEKTYCFNEEAFELMETFNISPFWMEKLSSFKDKTYNNEEMNRKMDYVFSPDGHKNTKMRVLEACSIAAYHRLTNIPVVSTLLSDDAPQFRKLTSQHANCWIHDGRNYKKLRSVVSYYQKKLEAFLDQYWDYYAKLCDFKMKPDAELSLIHISEPTRLLSISY